MNNTWYRTLPSNVNITQEVLPFMDIIYTILTMPFSFISQAFNLTLFPNTPYQINFATIILSILAVLILVLIVRIVLWALKNL